MAVTRRQVVEAARSSEGPTPFEFVTTALLLAGTNWTAVQGEWKPLSKPEWGALWNDGQGGMGFVSKLVVNCDRTFCSTDNEGRDRRIPIEGKKFFAPPQRGGG